MKVIQVTNVCKTYGDDRLKVEALKNATFSVEKGEFVCIIGASGSGKSTLLHLLAGVDQATSGKIMVNDKDITKLKSEDLAVFRRCEVGIIYQFFNLVPVLTAKENIELPLMLDDKKVDKKYFKEIVQTLNIQDRLNFYPSKLSGGEQQRIAIARALISRPSIILADEPTGNLNSKLAKEIMEFLVIACKKFNQTIIMITHDLNLTKYADRIIEIQDGMIVSDSQNQKQETPKRKTTTKGSTLFDAIEGLDDESGNYIILENAWQEELRMLYAKDSKGQSKGAISKRFAQYLVWIKKAMLHHRLLVFLDLENKKAVRYFKKTTDIFEYLNSLEQSGQLTMQRKREIIYYLNHES